MALIDAALIGAVLFFLLGDAWVISFHLIFVVLAIGAFYWSFTAFAVRAGLAVSIAAIGMTNFYRTGAIAAEELTEIPMLALILLLVFIIVRQRSKAQAELVAANQHLEQKVAARTAALEEEIEVRRQTEERLRASEEQYIRLIDLSFDAVSVTYLDGTVAYLNRAGLQTIGATSLDEVQGRSIFDFAHPDGREAMQKRLRMLQREGRGVLPTEEKFKRLDGQLIEVEMMTIPVIYEGRPAAQSVYRDLSDRKRLEAQCAEEQLNIAEHLHNSLGQSLSYLHLTLQDLADRLPPSSPDNLHETIAHTAEVANAAYDQVSDLLEDLVPPKLPELRNVVRDVAAMFSEKAGFEATVNCQGSFHPLPLTFRRHILFLCREALTNVTKYADAQHVTIDLVWREDSLSVTITDDGRGFNPLAVDPSSSFGIRIMEERVTQLNGRFSLKTAPGAGVEVMFQLPLP